MNLCIIKRDMVRAAKKHDMFGIRIAVGVIILILLFFIWLLTRIFPEQAEAIKPHIFSNLIFKVLIILYFIEFGIAIFLTIGLTSTKIPEERERKTLHFLMATPLSGLEIVLNVLIAAVARTTMIVIIGLPIIAVLCSLCGIDLLTTLLCHIHLLTSMWITGSLALCVSVGSKRPITAILAIFGISYFLSLFTFIFHGIFLFPNLTGPNRFIHIVSVLNEQIYPAHPFALPTDVVYYNATVVPNGFSIHYLLLKLVFYQFIYGCAFTALASYRLRRAFRKLEDIGSRPLIGKKGRWIDLDKRRFFRAVKRPPCGDRPMLWKEAFVNGFNAPMKIIGFLFILFVVFEIMNDLSDLIKNSGNNSSFSSLNEYIRSASTVWFLGWSILILIYTGTSIDQEIDADTWTAILLSPLSPREILFGKALGAVWRAKWTTLPLVLLWMIGLIYGGVHIVGVVLGLIALITFSWTIAVCGVWIAFITAHNGKLKLKGSYQGLQKGFSVWFLWNVAILSLNLPFIYSRFSLSLSYWTFIFSQPFIFLVSLLSIENMRLLISGKSFLRFGESSLYPWNFILIYIVSIGIHWIVVYLVCRSFDRRFDFLARRPVNPTILEIDED
jgi:hypothetical protein